MNMCNFLPDSGYSAHNGAYWKCPGYGYAKDDKVGLTFDQMMSHPGRHAIVKQLAGTFVELHAADPRGGTVFSTQQRWLMAQAGMAICFRDMTGDGPAAYSGLFLDKIEAEQIAARNTAHAFMLEMRKYGTVVERSPEKKGKIRLITLPETTVAGIAMWLLVHLAVLDNFDGGTRCSQFQRTPGAVSILQPAVADALIASESMRVPKGAFAHFTWLNEGGYIMDCLISRLQPAASDATRLLTSVISISEMAEAAMLSHTHLARKLRVAEEQGFLGWTGRRGRSTLWLSTEFRDEYEAYQVRKLELIEKAFEAIEARLSSRLIPV